MKTPLERAAEALTASRHAMALTGAGISVESGIPDFRSPGGIWDTYPPEEYATAEAFLRDPDRVWQMWYELAATIGEVSPNPAHHALTALQYGGYLGPIVTQNIDNLHQEAGSRDVIEFHGNARHMRCQTCQTVVPLRLDQRTPGAPRCGCGGLMKPDVVLFGDSIPVEAQQAANVAVAEADVLLVVGTSATVYPAAQIPLTAKANGACIIECNVETTEFTTNSTDYFLEGPASLQLVELVKLIRPQSPFTD